MTTTFNTRNPIGSTNLKDLSDNASNLDDAMNSGAPSWEDRFGKRRETLAGMEAQFANLLSSSAYVWVGDYAPGLTFTRRNQYTVFMGIAYRPADSVALPYTTTGNWATDQDNFVAFDSSAILSQDLNSTDPTKGISLVNGSVRVVANVAAMAALTGTLNPYVFTEGYYAPGDGGAGSYLFDPADTTTAFDGGSVVPGAAGARYKLIYDDHVTTAQFGAKLDGTSSNDSPFIQAALNWAKTAGVPIFMPAGRHVIATRISIPTGVAFSGVGSYMPINYLANEQTGSVLMITHGAGAPDGPSTFGTQTGSTFRNFVAIWPNQTLTNPPVGYPYLVAGEADSKGLYNDILIERLFLYNAFRFAKYTEQNGRICIQDIFGDVYNRALKLDMGLDCNYMRRHHYWAYSDLTATTEQQNALRTYKTANFIVGEIDRQDGFFMSDIFAIFAHKGLQLGSEGRVPYGIIQNLSWDAVQYGIDARYVGVQGLTITNMDYAMSSVITGSFGMVDAAPVVGTLQMGTLFVNNMRVWTEATWMVVDNPTSLAGGTIILNNPFIADTISKRLVLKQGQCDVIVRDMRVVPTSDNLLCQTTLGAKAAKFVNPDFGSSGAVYWDGAGPAPQVSSMDDGSETSITSASQLAIPAMPQKKRFLVTGSVPINAANIRPAGEEIHLRFAAPCVVNIGATFKIGTTMNATTGSTLSLVSDGTYWIQRSRFVL